MTTGNPNYAPNYKEYYRPWLDTEYYNHKAQSLLRMPSAFIARNEPLIHGLAAIGALGYTGYLTAEQYKKEHKKRKKKAEEETEKKNYKSAHRQDLIARIENIQHRSSQIANKLTKNNKLLSRQVQLLENNGPYGIIENQSDEETEIVSTSDEQIPSSEEEQDSRPINMIGTTRQVISRPNKGKASYEQRKARERRLAEQRKVYPWT